MEIKHYNEENKKDIETFLNRITLINNINQDVINNACIIWRSGEVDAILSYEVFSAYGLIRYFIFHRHVTFDEIVSLFTEVVDFASSNNIEYLITIVEKEELAKIFEKLGFISLSPDELYFDEISLNNKYPNASAMIYKIVKKPQTLELQS